MNSLLSQVEPVATEAVWRLQTHWTFAPWLTVVIITAAVGLVVYCYTRESSPAGAAYRGLLGVLRITTIVLILVMLSELLLAGTRSGRPRFGWVLDLSGSMTTIDPDAPGQLSRIDQVKQTLLADDAKLVAAVVRDYDTELSAVGGAAQRQPLRAGSLDHQIELMPPDTSVGLQRFELIEYVLATCDPALQRRRFLKAGSLRPAAEPPDSGTGEQNAESTTRNVQQITEQHLPQDQSTACQCEPAGEVLGHRKKLRQRDRGIQRSRPREQSSS